MPEERSIKLYDLVVASGCTISPFVWRTKYAIAHKGFRIETIPMGFTNIPEKTGGRTERLPMIDDNGTFVTDSWKIAEYLDETYPDRPMLFEGPSQKILTKFIDGWIWQNAIGPYFGCYVADNVDRAFPEDRDYLRESRSRLFLGGKSPEEFVAGREERIPGIRKALEPLRALLKDTPWIGGEKPNYADYCVLACFLWAGSIASYPPLEAGDPLLDWINRGFDLYGGLGRHPGMQPMTAAA